VSVVLLAGGSSERLGRDKAFVEIAGREILERVLSAAAEISDVVIVGGDVEALEDALARYATVSAKGDGHYRCAQRDLRLLSDESAGLGPLEGMRVGLGACAGPTWVVSCDLPFVVPAIAVALSSAFDAAVAAGHAADVVVPRIGGRRQSLCAMYDTSIAELAAEALARGERSVHGLLEGLAVVELDEAAFAPIGPPEMLFFNLNTAADAARAHELAQRQARRTEEP